MLTIPFFPPCDQIVFLSSVILQIQNLHPLRSFTKLHLLTGLAVALLSFLGMVAHKASGLQSAIEVQSGGETLEREIFPPNSGFHLWQVTRRLSWKHSSIFCLLSPLRTTVNLIRWFYHILTFSSGTSGPHTWMG